ncbi:MATE family efflux transporter [Marivita sp. S6314]|uniref:MATE family efflux transporter n=1 Tax=Marivita sp. S6314 TaxID=2926406 RepID=UPI001FF47364|nr:MATE family efflux transporter [Marivita sp. S6314]MCK0149551.1 MATE family efflux transporter [Marivita sp. S6314]
MSYPAHVRAVLVLGMPLVGGHLAQMAIGLTDTIMVGWYGAEALATVTLANTLFFTVFLVGAGFAMAVMPMVAKYQAEGDDQKVRRSTRMGVWLSAMYCVGVFPLMWWSDAVLQALGQTPEISGDAQIYLRVLAFGVLPALITMTLKSYLAALEKTQVVFWVTVVAVPFNAVANYALIFGNFGFPELGLKGAAIASLSTHIFSCAVVIGYISVFVTQHALFQRLWKSDPDMLSEVFRLGWPIGLTLLSETGLFAASAIMMGWLGTVPLAAHGIAIQLASLTFMLHLGLSNAATVRAGNALGRKDVSHLVRGGIVALVMSVLIALVTVVIFVAFPEALISIFLDPDDPARPQIIVVGVVLLIIAAVFQLMDGAQVIALGLLRGVQDTRMPMVWAAVSYFGVGLPAAYIFGFVLNWGGPGIWGGLVLGLAVAAVLLNHRFWALIVPGVARRVGESAS